MPKPAPPSLYAELLEAHEQIALRDADIGRLQAEFERVSAEAEAAHAQLDRIRRTRLWRSGLRVWRIRDRLLRRGRGS